MELMLAINTRLWQFQTILKRAAMINHNFSSINLPKVTKTTKTIRTTKRATNWGLKLLRTVFTRTKSINTWHLLNSPKLKSQLSRLRDLKELRDSRNLTGLSSVRDLDKLCYLKKLVKDSRSSFKDSRSVLKKLRRIKGLKRFRDLRRRLKGSRRRLKELRRSIDSRRRLKGSRRRLKELRRLKDSRRRLK